MKKIKILFLLVILASLSCTPFLNVVPDNTRTINDMFKTKDAAYNALAKIYAYMPNMSSTNNTSWSLGDEYVGRLDYDYIGGFVWATQIMRGLQSPGSPILDDWTGLGAGKRLYEGISQCNIFLEHINEPVDMTDEQKTEWAAQATFLKAYYNFLLIQKYGPIVIMDKAISPTAMSTNLFMSRQKLDSCFNYVIGLMDQAIPNLRTQIVGVDLGQIDQIGALAIKARIMLFRASPFYNGNKDYYEDFLDHDGQPFFPLEYKPEKWKDALDACNAALDVATANGKDLFTYDLGIYYGKDKEDIGINEDAIKKLYDLRMLIVIPWNKELLWGYSNISFGDGDIAQGCNIRLPQAFKAESGGDADVAAFSWNWFCATYAMAERYYTANGLPIDEDLTFDRNKIYNMVNLPPVDDPQYQQYAGILQPGAETIYLYMNREPRFYANLGITGGYWRGHLIRIPTILYQNTYGGMNLAVNSTDYFCTGIGIQKFVHPESTSGTQNRQQHFPYPIIRLADLILMKAEVLNEYSGPSQEVYDLINKVRRRAGIPDVEVSWAAGGTARTPDKHKSKDGLRDIILQERSIELAFEGSRFWDMLRYKRATLEFNSPVWGWNPFGTNAQTFFVLEAKQARKFSITSCLWPIPLSELNMNANLIQNPGW